MAKQLSYYQQRRTALEKQIRSIKKKNQKISAEIDRLEEAYNKLGKIKRDNEHNADKVRDMTKLKKVAGDVKWRGKNKNDFDDIMDDKASPAAKDFFRSIDEMHDEVGKALYKKKGELQSGSTTLNVLNKTYQNVKGIIKNWTN